MVGGSLFAVAALVWKVLVFFLPPLDAPLFPPWMLLGIGGVIFLNGAYEAWRHERRLRRKAQGELRKLQAGWNVDAQLMTWGFGAFYVRADLRVSIVNLSATDIATFDFGFHAHVTLGGVEKIVYLIRDELTESNSNDRLPWPCSVGPRREVSGRLLFILDGLPERQSYKRADRIIKTTLTLTDRFSGKSVDVHPTAIQVGIIGGVLDPPPGQL